ncbi:type III pantothenate kinase [Marinobacter pelagius]|uniref:Type III pantothenate kinase n=1 Tax=Marinobacter pelagius TaxID=379482 RepID=A0A366G0G5_9GAMM|nr:type III pantothenate kinase [Marinobacter pelagius]RBP19455.1 type III pantothenate kinase [Marinobacter pelagius]
MRLLIDAGNTRLKWQLGDRQDVVASGVGDLSSSDPLQGLPPEPRVRRISISTVAAEARREALVAHLERRFGVAAVCHWSEPERGGLRNAYQDYQRMGADRWHAMYGAWKQHREGFVVVDAGSAVTVDYVDHSGQHLGGFILPGLQMMIRSLQTDAARILFDLEQVLETAPGISTGECVNHGLAWLFAAMIDRIRADVSTFALRDILVTGGDAERLQSLGLNAIHAPDLVLRGLAAIDAEELAI